MRIVDLLDYKVIRPRAVAALRARRARLGMSPSALTRRVQAMEDALGHRLFIRDTEKSDDHRR